MQQLQNTYGGDRSDTLATILGLDYDPQGYMAQMANNMLQTGMSSSTNLKTTAMAQNAADNRQFIQNQLDMNKARREESKLRAMSAGQLRGQRRAMVDTLGTYMGMLDPNDPFARQEAAAMQQQISGLEGILNRGGTLEEQAAVTKYLTESGLADPTVAGGMVLLQRKAAEAKAREDAMNAILSGRAPKAQKEEEPTATDDEETDLGL